MSNLVSDFKHRFIKALNKENISASELLERVKIHDPKMSLSTISQYKSGYSKPKTKRTSIIANALNVSPSWLIGYDVPMEPIEFSDSLRKIQYNITTFMNEISSVRGCKINVLGEVAAGIPIQAIKSIVDTEEISEKIARTGEFFGLRIK